MSVNSGATLKYTEINMGSKRNMPAAKISNVVITKAAISFIAS
jgi:hypothetical protein